MYSTVILFVFSEIEFTWDKQVNKTLSDTMNAAISHKCRSITFNNTTTSRRNYENLIIQIQIVMMQNIT